MELSSNAPLDDANITDASLPSGREGNAHSRHTIEMTKDTPGADYSKSQMIFVLGMHRAGTSAITRVVNLLGASLPTNLLGKNESNPQGHWESKDIIALHDAILASARSSWIDEFDIDKNWFTSIIAADWVRKIRLFVLETLTSSPIFVIKDPRLCLVFPLWVEALKQIGIEPRCVLPFRSPIEVAESLSKRDAHGMPGGFLPPERGHLLWLRYVLSAERHTRGLRRTFVAFDALLSDWENETARIADQLGIVWPLQDRGTRGEIFTFLSREHKHQDQGADALLTRLGPVYERVHSQLYDCVQQPEAGRLTFDTAHRELVGSLQLVEDYLRSYSGVVGKLHDELSSANASLKNEQVARAQLTQVIAEANATADAEAHRLKSRLADVDAQVVRLTKDLDEARSKIPTLESSLQNVLQAVSVHAEDLDQQARQAESVAVSERDNVNRLGSTFAAIQASEHASEVAWSEAQHQVDHLIRQRQAILQTRMGRMKTVARSIVRPENELAGSQLKFMVKLIAATDEARRLYSKLEEHRQGRRQAEEIAHAAEPNASQWESTAAALRVEADRIAELHKAQVQRMRHPGDRELLEGTYALWAERYDTITEADRRAIRAQLSTLVYRPLVSVVMPVFNTPTHLLHQAIRSVQSQLYPNWQLCIADDASTNPEINELLVRLSGEDKRLSIVTREENGHICAATNSALTLAKGEFVALMDHDDILPEHALFEVVAALNRNRDLDVIYSDEDHIDDAGQRSSPYFKTDYNPDLFVAHNLISHLGVFRRTLIEKINGFRIGYEGSQDYDLALRAIDATSPDRVHHIPAVLYHWRQAAGKATFSETFMQKCILSARQAVTDHLQRKGEAGRVVEHPLLPLWQRVVRPVPDPAPLVSVIIPTRDRGDLLKACLDGVMNRTEYPNLEIVIVDHQSTEPRTLRLFGEVVRDQRVRVIPYQGAFNYSAINNFAVAETRGNVIAFLNNDVDVINQEWLREMVGLAVLPDIGAVGAKLLYPDGRVQHAGVALGVGGVANHFFHLLGRAEPGYCGRACLTSTVSAVTAACLVVRRSVFNEVGGFDAANLPVAFNDVDLCLKVRSRSYRNVWTPHALLYHHESASRGSDETQEQIERFGREVEFMQQKWAGILEEDPFYNPNLNIGAADFTMAFPPRREKPWQAGKES